MRRISIFFLIILNSCLAMAPAYLDENALTVYEFESLVPSEENLIPDSASVLLFSNDPRITKSNISSVINYQYKQLPEDDKIWFSQHLTELLYSKILHCPKIKTVSTSDSYPATLEFEEADAAKICAHYQSDFVLQFDRFDMTIEINPKDAGFDWELNAPYYIGSGAINSYIVINYFRSDGHKGQIDYTDSRRHIAPEYFNYPSDIEKYTDIKSLLSDEAEDFSAYLVSQVTPYWRLQSRQYYKNINRQFSLAGTLLETDQWRDAFYLWEKILNTGKEKHKKYALYNIILSYELSEQIDSAISTAEKHLKLYNTDLTRDYLQTLEQRKTELIKLNKQLNIN